MSSRYDGSERRSLERRLEDHLHDPYAHNEMRAAMVDTFREVVAPLANRIDEVEREMGKQNERVERRFEGVDGKLTDQEAFRQRMMGAILTIGALVGGGLVTLIVELFVHAGSKSG